MESGGSGQAMIYKLEGDERIPFACHADEASAYAAIAAIEAEEEAVKEIDEILMKMEEIIEEEETMQSETETVEAKELDLGDMVNYTTEDNETSVGVIEDIDDENLTVTIREYASASNGEFEPTDNVMVVPLESVQAYTEEPEQAADEMLDEEKEDMEEEDFPKHRILAKLRYVKSEEITTDDDQKIGIIEGYASTYGNTDLGGDVVEKGAFKQTLLHKGGIVPLLLDHGYKTQDVAGIAFLEDDEKGLYMKAEMPLDVPEVLSAFRKTKFMIDKGGKMGLSIGYDTVKSMPGDDGIRKLKELALHEVSITPFPMNTEAQIMAAKNRKMAAQKNVTRRKAVTKSKGRR
jgi:HK97 family phage prohead protease